MIWVTISKLEAVSLSILSGKLIFIVQTSFPLIFIDFLNNDNILVSDDCGEEGGEWVGGELFPKETVKEFEGFTITFHFDFTLQG